MQTNTVSNSVEDFTVYVVMWNLPGCMPEMDPMVCNTVEEARDALLEAVSVHMNDDCTYEPEYHEQWKEMWYSVKYTPEHDLPNNRWMGPDGYVYSIQQDFER